MAYQPKSYRKFIATAATATLVATAVTPAFAAEFTDVNKNYKDAVDYLVENDIAKGTTETTFGTENSITRGDAAVMIANALQLDVDAYEDAPFEDVNSRVKGAVNALYAEEIISGKTETTYLPEANITRAEMAKILTNAYQLEAGDTKNEFTDVNSSWDGYVDALVANEITMGKTETTFEPDQDVTRGEFALFMFRAKDFLGEVGGIELQDLPEGAWEVQDNTVTDTWGVVLQHDKLPADMQNAEKYTITIGEKTYELTKNKFNSNVYSVQVSSVEHTKAEVEAGVVDVVEKAPVEETVLDTLPAAAWEIQDNTVTDTWGVVLKHDQLPANLQGGTSYAITIDGKEYELTKNKFNANVFSGQVSSVEHTKEQVAKGVIVKK
ncbi:hypothetical protein CD798_15910 [Bacillaceae bacterium SAOS 7]|nr:hypothetical protein CD798_15910 [Bacillaceae bacterium SAOS 7]